MMPSPVRSFSSAPVSSPMPPSLRCPYGSASPRLHHLAADEGGALGDRHHGVAARVGLLVGQQHAREPVDVEGDLGDDGPVDAGQVGRDERRLAAVAPEHLHDREALVRPGAGAQLVDEVDRARHRRREADAVVGAVDVVVHRLRDADDREALVVEAEGERQRVVAADRHQRVDLQPLQHAEAVLGEVVGTLADGLRRQAPAAPRRPSPGPGWCGSCAAPCRPSGRWCGRPRDRAPSCRTSPTSATSGLHSSSPAQPRRMPTA